MEIQFPPGVVKSDSLAASVGRYVEADHVRWVGGHAEKIGGWKKLFAQQLEGVPRGSHVYRAPSGLEVFVWGTEFHLYFSEPNPSLPPGGTPPTNITPFRLETTLTNPFKTTINDPVVEVTHANHGVVTGDTVYFAGADPVGGITINGFYNATTIQSVDPPLRDVNKYLITHSTAATSSVAAGGGTVEVKYEVNIGTAGALEGPGYGVGLYGEDLYGDERVITDVALNPRYWSLDNYGTRLLASYQGGTIYLWDQDAEVRPVALENAPSDMIFAFVTEERYIFALRRDMVVSWPDQDDPTDWTPTLTNRANERKLAKGNRLMAGTALGGGVSLVWTDTSLYQFQFTGGQFIYSSRLAGTNCGIIGPGAFCVAEGAAFWLGTNSFHIYNGSVQGIPNSDDVHAWFYGNMTPENRRKSMCWYNAEAREVWFTAALGNEANTKDRPIGSEYADEPPAPAMNEPTHYVYVNVDSWHWGAGVLPRSSATYSITRGILLGSPDGYIYQHEMGVDADTVALPTLLKSGLFRIESAEKNLDIFGFSPDFEWQVGIIKGRVFTQDRPMNTLHADNQEFDLEPTTGMRDIRVRGRYIGFELSQSVLGGDWRMGIPVAEFQEAGARR